MQDVFQKYHNSKLKHNAMIVITSLFFAFAINASFFGNLNWMSLQSNIMWANQTNSPVAQADVYLERVWNKLLLKNAVALEWVKNFNTSLVYNPELIKTVASSTQNQNITLNAEKLHAWVENIFLSSTDATIAPGSVLAEIEFMKNDTQNTSVSLINTNFETISWEMYKLSVSWIEL